MNPEEVQKLEDKTLIKSLEEKIPMFLIVIVSYFILSLKPLNNLMIRMIPRFNQEGDLSLIAIFIKSLIMGLIYLVSSFFFKIKS